MCILWIIVLLDVNECDNASVVCANGTVCENTIGSYKCVSKPQKKTTVLQDEDYDAEDENDDYEYGEEGVHRNFRIREVRRGLQEKQKWWMYWFRKHWLNLCSILLHESNSNQEINYMFSMFNNFYAILL